MRPRRGAFSPTLTAAAALAAAWAAAWLCAPATPAATLLADIDVEAEGGRVSVWHDVTVEAGQVIDDDLVTTGGTVTIHGEVTGDVVVIGGRLDIDGRVDGDTVAILTDATLAPSAVLEGDFVHLGGTLDASPEATVRGEMIHLEGSKLVFGEDARSAARGVMRLIYLVKVLLFLLLFWGMLVAVCITPKRITAAGEALGQVWGRAIFMGLLAYAAYFVLAGIFLVLCLILVGVPLLSVLVVAWFVIKAMGLAAILWAVGDRVARNLLRRDMSAQVAFLIGFLIYLPTQILPSHLGIVWLALGILGSVLHTCMSMLAAGLMLVTQFGTVTRFPSQRPYGRGAEPPPPAPEAVAP